MKCLFKLISLLSLATLHRLGSILGCLAYALGGSYRRKMLANLKQAGFDPKELTPVVKRHLGMQGLETPWVWMRSNADVYEHVFVDEQSKNVIRRALDSGRSIIFMTPHVGCFEIAPIWVYEAFLKQYGKTMTVLYREPKLPCLRELVATGRLRDGMDPAKADLSGVRKILKAMKAGGIMGCLPDQVPGRGEGVWADFFGRPAFTMTFPLKMARQFDAIRIMAWTVRLPGKGWELSVVEWDEPLTGDLQTDARAMNRVLEETIKKVPDQYIWSYNRYKIPRGVKAPEQVGRKE